MIFHIVRCRRIGPEKGVIHIALGAVDNALWDMFARARGKPLWKLVVDMTPASAHATCAPYVVVHLEHCVAITGGNCGRHCVPLHH